MSTVREIDDTVAPATLERLRKSKADANMRDARQGDRDGRDWALRRAEWRHLQVMEEMAQEFEDVCSFDADSPGCLAWALANRLRVRLDGDPEAWRRRLLIVRYESPPVKMKIPDFGQLLVKTEGSGILNWALAGLVDLFQDIAAIGDIVLTPRQRGVVDALLTESDSLGHYLQDRVVKDATGDLTVEEIVTGYLQHCPTKGWVPIPTTMIQRRLEERMLELFQTSKSNSIERGGVCCRGFRNVRFKI